MKVSFQYAIIYIEVKENVLNPIVERIYFMKKSMYTSINAKKLPKAHSLLDNITVRRITGGITVGKDFILDHGCGRYVRHIAKHANDLGYAYLGWDEYWGGKAEHVRTWDCIRMEFDRGNEYRGMRAIHISSNVMNVITDDWELENYCTRVYDSMNVGEYLILTVYEADTPSETQRAEPLSLYVEKLESYYGFITKKQTKGYAILMKP